MKSKTVDDFSKDCYDAFNCLGGMYKYGHSVEVNYEEAFKCYSKAARQSMDNGKQFNLAVIYSEEREAAVDHKLALYWFRMVQPYQILI